MENKEAIEYLLYMKHDVQAGSPVDVAIDTAIEALKETAKMPKRNREMLMEQSFYDLLCSMNANFMNGKPHCVIEAITGEIMICKHESCNQCIADYLNEYAGNCGQCIAALLGEDTK